MCKNKMKLVLLLLVFVSCSVGVAIQQSDGKKKGGKNKNKGAAKPSDIASTDKNAERVPLGSLDISLPRKPVEPLIANTDHVDHVADNVNAVKPLVAKDEHMPDNYKPDPQNIAKGAREYPEPTLPGEYNPSGPSGPGPKGGKVPLGSLDISLPRKPVKPLIANADHIKPMLPGEYNPSGPSGPGPKGGKGAPDHGPPLKSLVSYLKMFGLTKDLLGDNARNLLCTEIGRGMLKHFNVMRLSMEKGLPSVAEGQHRREENWKEHDNYLTELHQAFCPQLED